MIQSGAGSFTLELHPRLTVVAGMGALERDGLTGELIGGLAGGRSGLHAELVTDGDRRLALFRPQGGRHRVIDVGSALDVTAEFQDDAGRIDLLAHSGLDARHARRRMRLSESDLSTGTHGAELVRRLASEDQEQLWSAADEMTIADERLQAEADASGSAPEDASVIQRIEDRHRAFEAAQARHERFRRLSLIVALMAATGAVPALLFLPLAAIGCLVLSASTMLAAITARRRAERAARAEVAALAEAGASSYLGFHIQRVNGLLDSDHGRRRLVSAAEGHRAALARWRAIAGDVGLDWALDHREEIVATARLRREVTALSALSSTAPEIDDDRATDLARLLVARLAELRHFGADGESFPLVLDDPFHDLDPGVKPSLLELLGHTAGSPQLVFLTDDEDVASWARLEALTGALAVVEPVVQPA